MASLDSASATFSGTDDIERALVGAREQGLGIERCTILFNSVSPALVTRGALAANEVTRDGLDFTLRHGLEAYALSFRVGLVESLEQIGDWDRALVEAAGLVSVLEESEDAWDLASLRSLQTLMLSWRGQSAEAARLVDALEAAGASSEVGWTAACALLAASVARLALGEDPREPASTGAVPGRAACSGITRGQRTRGREGRSRRPAMTRLAAWVMRRSLNRVQRRRDCRCNSLSRPPWRRSSRRGAANTRPACVGFADAARRWREFGIPYEEGHALFGQGKLPRGAWQKAGGAQFPSPRPARSSRGSTRGRRSPRPMNGSRGPPRHERSPPLCLVLRGDPARIQVLRAVRLAAHRGGVPRGRAEDRHHSLL